ncbi:C-type lectin domain family 6 member A-like isoform 1-T1 [Ara ararauna]
MVEIMNHRGTVSPGTAASAEERCCSRLTPWVFIASGLAIKTVIVTVCLVVFLHGSYGQYMTLVQNATGWHCVPSVSAGIEEGWECCPKGWKRFQGSCYYLSGDVMSWAESEQNCTGMGSHLVVINSKAEQVSAGLREGHSSQSPSASMGGDSVPLCPAKEGGGMSFVHPFSTGSRLPPAPLHRDSCHLPLLSPVSHGHCTLPHFQDFLFNLAKGVFTNAYETKYYIGLTSYKTGQWQWVDQTPYDMTTTFWKPGEPNLLFAEKCAAIHVKGNRDPSTYSNWNNILCFTSCYRICELPAKYV